MNGILTLAFCFALSNIGTLEVKTEYAMESFKFALLRPFRPWNMRLSGEFLKTIASNPFLAIISLQIRALWRHYYEGTDGLIYVVDSNDRDRAEEARLEFQSLLSEPDMANATILVFANKQDLPNAYSVAEITEKLQIHSIPQRNWHVQACCGVDGTGLYEGLDWLSNAIASRK